METFSNFFENCHEKGSRDNIIANIATLIIWLGLMAWSIIYIWPDIGGLYEFAFVFTIMAVLNVFLATMIVLVGALSIIEIWRASEKILQKIGGSFENIRTKIIFHETCDYCRKPMKRDNYLVEICLDCESSLL